MYAASVPIEIPQDSLKPSYSYTGKVLGFIFGEVNLFFMMFPFADFFVTFGKWINLTSVTNMCNSMFAMLSLVYLFFAVKDFKLYWARTVTLLAMVVLIIVSFVWVDASMKADAKSFIIRTVFTVVQTFVIVKIFFEKGEEYVLDVLKRFAIIIGVLATLSIALFPSESSWTIDDTGRKQAFFSAPNNLGQFLTFFFLILNFYKRTSIKLPLLLLLNGMIVYMAMGCDSKTSITGGIICFVLFKFRFLIRPFLVFILCIGLYLPYYTQTFEKGEAEKIEFAKRDMTFTGRSDVWHIMLEDIQMNDKILAGFGAGAYWGEKEFHPKARIHELTWEPHQGHNGYLDLRVNLGLIGAFIFVLFIIQHFTNIFRVMNDKNIVILFISVIFCINNITETSFFRGKHFYFVLMLLIFWYTCFKTKEDPEDERSPSPELN